MELSNPVDSKLSFDQLVLERVKSQLFKKTTTLRSLGRTFRAIDMNGDRKVDKEEFYVGLKEMGVQIS